MGTGLKRLPDRIYQLLLIEDSQADVRLYKEVMRSWKTRHCLYVADDGDEAMDFLHNRGNYDGAPRPDLIFLDLNLPKMDGFQILRCIREDENSEIRAIPVVVVTSSAAEQDVIKAYEVGANIFITKPTDFDEFARVMSRLESFWFELVTALPPSLPPTCETNQPQDS